MLKQRGRTFFPRLLFIHPRTRAVGDHSLSKSTFVSFPMSRAIVCPRCHQGAMRLNGVRTAVSSIEGSGSISVVSM